ncbi:MAG: hypothetical protein IJT02_04950 [Synergistaceae bacterium]|nr:hypothetical protein [Synergistaceae bacterium]
MKKMLCALLLVVCTVSEALAASNSADAFMSLTFGLTFARVQKRMEDSGAAVLTPRKESLTMDGMFEGYPAMFIFGFHKKKILKSKAVYIMSMGDAEADRRFYEAVQKAYNAYYGSGKETPTANTRVGGKIMLRNVWTPDRYTTITLTYNPELSKRFAGTSLNSRFLQLICKYDKWDD